MFFEAFEGWKNIGRPGQPEIAACFKRVASAKNRRGAYNEVALKNMLRNPPPAFEQQDRDLVLHALALEHPSCKR
ncbi:MAG: hypothetical protein DI626_02275 [Micavibrio aeruginosavorus]|uniref:Uncharacterized protein n=1 Tax=Micavibrio aeruginosavorus TaxID=349221 RepID=A0A2W5A6V7_9BACT|nr:MAG: hypothetical protein DI626_02275 [Micavibrio aeruginosavorus]